MSDLSKENVTVLKESDLVEGTSLLADIGDQSYPVQFFAFSGNITSVPGVKLLLFGEGETKLVIPMFSQTVPLD